jgi:hypothetical protein
MKPWQAFIQGEIPVTVVTPWDILARERCKPEFRSECTPVWCGRSLTPEKTVNRVISSGRSFGLARRKEAIEASSSPVGVTQFRFDDTNTEKTWIQVVHLKLDRFHHTDGLPALVLREHSRRGMKRSLQHQKYH